MIDYYPVYRYYHDSFPTERYAEIRSNYLTFEILKRVYDIKELWYFQYVLFRKLIDNYDDNGIYPLEYFDEIVKVNLMPEFNHLIPDVEPSDASLYERLIIGLPITDKEVEYLKGISDDYFISRENCKDLEFDLSTTLVKKLSTHLN